MVIYVFSSTVFNFLTYLIQLFVGKTVYINVEFYCGLSRMYHIVQSRVMVRDVRIYGASDNDNNGCCDVE